MSKDSSKEAGRPRLRTSPKGFYADIAATGGYNSYDTRRSALQGEPAATPMAASQCSFRHGL